MSLYKERIAKGLCGACGKEPCEPESSLGTLCKQKAKERAAAKRAKFQAAGGCLGCGRKISSGSRCPTCKAQQRESRKRVIAEKKQAGICVVCTEPAKPGCTLCQKHIDERTQVSLARYYKNKAAGKCRICGVKVRKGAALCEEHREVDRQRKLGYKLAALDAYGGRCCSGCPEDNVAILEIDHINGGGNEHRRMVGKGHMGSGSGSNFYRWLKRNGYPAGFRVLCPTCNKKAHAGVPLPNASH